MHHKPSVFQDLAVRLALFTWVDEHKAHCRCPLCGDSKKSKTKRRGGFLEPEPGQWVYKCLNCGESLSLSSFLKQYDYELYREYRLEKIKEHKNRDVSISDINNRKTDGQNFQDKSYLPGHAQELALFKGLERLTELPSKHPAVQYALTRKFKRWFCEELYYAPDFDVHAQQFVEKDLYKSGIPAIVIPWIWMNGEEFGLQARYLSGEFRYKMVIVDNQFPKIFGMNRIDKTKPIHVTEGAFDSQFLPNCIATGDSALNRRLPELQMPKKQFRLWFDYDARYNKQLYKQMEDAIDEGYTVVFYPDSFVKYGKDINELVINSTKAEARQIMSQIKALDGIKAKIMLKSIKSY